MHDFVNNNIWVPIVVRELFTLYPCFVARFAFLNLCFLCSVLMGSLPFRLVTISSDNHFVLSSCLDIRGNESKDDDEINILFSLNTCL